MVMEVVMINTEAEAKTELHVWAQSRTLRYSVTHGIVLVTANSLPRSRCLRCCEHYVFPLSDVHWFRSLSCEFHALVYVQRIQGIPF
eukprot:597978-Rhodomonas_salina.1